jgi:hypothetical protein
VRVTRLDDRLLPGAADVDVEVQAPILAGTQRAAVSPGKVAVPVPDGLRERRRLQRVHRTVADPSAVLQRRRGGDGLVDGDRPDRPGDHRELGDRAPPVRDAGRREREVLARVGEAFAGPGSLDDLHRLLEHLPVRPVRLPAHLVVARGDDGAQALRLPRHGSPADPEDHPSAGHDVGHREVLGQPQRVPLRYHVEHLAEAQPPGPAGQRHPHEDVVGHHLIALVLEVVLGQPERVVAQPVRGHHPVRQVLVPRDDVVVAIPAIGGHRTGVPRVCDRNATVEVDVDLHGCLPSPPPDLIRLTSRRFPLVTPLFRRASGAGGRPIPRLTEREVDRAREVPPHP